MCLHQSRDLPPPPPTPDLLQPVLCGNPHKVGSCSSVHCRPHCLMLSCPIPGDRSLIAPAFLWRREKGGHHLWLRAEGVLVAGTAELGGVSCGHPGGCGWKGAEGGQRGREDRSRVCSLSPRSHDV